MIVNKTDYDDYIKIRKLLAYDPITGILTWIGGSKYQKNIGKKAGAFNSNGYIQIKINGKRYFAHRIAWLLSTGSWPKNEIDHKNGIRDDNRIENLRESTRKQNMQNMCSPKTAKSKLIGAQYNTCTKKWKSTIRCNGITKYLGNFETEKDAHAAYIKAKMENHKFQPIPRNTMEIEQCQGVDTE